jgi:hypothetical protein
MVQSNTGIQTSALLAPDERGGSGGGRRIRSL